MNKTDGFKPWSDYRRLPAEEMQQRARDFLEEMKCRRSVRAFSDEPVPPGVIEACLRTAGSAPSGANRQPWHFVVVNRPETKAAIREAAEREERAFYGGRAPEEWLRALRPFGTTADKPFLEKAPVLVAVFAQSFQMDPDNTQRRNYYVNESVGLACGFLVAALHPAGLACLVHTPSPMGFLHDILDRPNGERAFLLLVVGYPAEGVEVPVLTKRSFEEIVSFR